MPNIMNPVLPAQGAQRPLEAGKQTTERGNSFSDHLENRVRQQESRQSDKLGVRARQEKSASVERQNREKTSAARQEEKDTEEIPTADLLALLLQELQQVAQDKEVGPGEWQLAMPDHDLLSQLAAAAGMEETEITTLFDQFNNSDGETSLENFLQTLITHFQNFASDQPVTTAETDLPMLETLLGKLGLTSEQISAIVQNSVSQDDALDLERFAAALAKVDIPPESLATIPLTEWETEQLQNLMSRADVTLGEQLKLLPETLQDKPALFDLARLQELLEKTIALAKAEQPSIKPAEFLAGLEKILQQTGFASQEVGLSPVIQQSRGEAYQNLLDIFEQTQLRYSEGLQEEEQKLQADIQKWLAKVVSPAGDKVAAMTRMKGDGTEPDAALLQADGGQDGALPHTSTSQTSLNPTEQNTTVTAQANQPPRPQANHIHQQQLFNQLSMAINRGLRSGEHHLILKLHPAELGEVKVDLTVRHEHISVSFAMENSRVKETLESSMDEFRQNMEDKGFTMGQVNVSVGQEESGASEWQRFELPSWPGEKLTASTLEDVPESTLYIQGNRENYHDERGLSLFV